MEDAISMVRFYVIQTIQRDFWTKFEIPSIQLSKVGLYLQLNYEYKGVMRHTLTTYVNILCCMVHSRGGFILSKKLLFGFLSECHQNPSKPIENVRTSNPKL
uniref:Uncharacterized protein n=1 Tax=Cacopsylla melanoneura TaxID=428564 RepID=A0A8D8LNB8_9HEMI